MFLIGSNHTDADAQNTIEKVMDLVQPHSVFVRNVTIEFVSKEMLLTSFKVELDYPQYYGMREAEDPYLSQMEREGFG